MMSLIQRRLVALFLVALTAFTAVPAFADDAQDDAALNNKPTATAMLGDGLFARPVLMVLTATGVVMFVATLPFSLLGGNVGDASEMLITGPAKSTFLRCLGCSAAQNEWKNKKAE